MPATHSRARPHYKRAEGGTDRPFESSFSDLAHAVLVDKAPALSEYEIGFQLLDRNEDENKAAGILAFRIGTQMLYAPCFFIDGDLKGQDLLYLKSQDMFVPFKENWVNYILHKRPMPLGEEIGRNSGRLGVQAPDLRSFSTSPGKYAAAMPSWAQQALPGLARAVTENPLTGWKPRLPEFLKDAGLPGLKALQKMASTYPGVARALNAFYTADELAPAFAVAQKRAGLLDDLDAPIRKTASRRPQGKLLDGLTPETRLHPIKAGSLQVYKYDLEKPDDVPAGLSDEEREKLLEEKQLIKDDRSPEDVSKAYRVDTSHALTNPDTTGIYDVLTGMGEYEKCLVLVHPWGGDGKQSMAVVVRIEGEEGGRNWTTCRVGKIFVGKKYDEDKTWKEFVDGLPDADSLELEDYSQYVLLSEIGIGTLPFHVDTDRGDSEQAKAYGVHFDNQGHLAQEFTPGDVLAPYQTKSQQGAPIGCCGSYTTLILQKREGTKIRADQDALYVPTSFKKLLVKKRKLPDWMKQRVGDSGASEPPAITPGNLADFQLGISKESQALVLRVRNGEVKIGDERLTKAAAVLALVVRHGFTEKVARVMLHEAEEFGRVRGGSLTYHVKYADPFLRDSGPSAPPFPEEDVGTDDIFGSGYPMRESQIDQVPVTDMAASPDAEEAHRANGGNSGNDRYLQSVQQASQTGQKEVFDTAMLGSMLRVTRDDLMVDRYLGDIVKGMDRIGRLLLFFYWNRDKFEERYGKNDVPELEDALRTSFEQVGELALFLKQKTIDSEMDNRIRLDDVT